ncbi:MAG: hypothetical protein ABI690_13555 [Chloroflexota bacterium]
MGNNVDVNILKSVHARIFVQHEGSSPANPYEYVGPLSLGGLQHDLGTGEPILIPSSEVRGKFDSVDTTSPPPSLPTTDFTQAMDRLLRDFWWDLRKRGCRFNMAIVLGVCQRPDDPDDFDGKILVRDSQLTAFNTDAFNTPSEDAVVNLTGSLLLEDFDRFMPLGVGSIMGASVLTESLDGLFADKVQCGSCGTPSDGCQRLYVLTKDDATDPENLIGSNIAYSINGGGASAADEIDSLNGLGARRIAQVGRYIVAVSDTDDSHHFKLQSSIDAGTLGGWTKVPTGYVATHGPRAIWSKSPSQTYIVGELGYIYQMRKPSSGVTVLSDGTVTSQTLNDVRGFGSTIVAVGNSNAIVVSPNRGRSWELVVGPVVGQNINTVEMVSKSIWFIGYANGKGYFTTDAGDHWTLLDLPPTASAINMIRFVDEIVGYLCLVDGGAGEIYRTGDNGYSWHTDDGDSSYLDGVPASGRYNFVAPCPGNYNRLLAGGIDDTGTDGVVALGAGATA